MNIIPELRTKPIIELIHDLVCDGLKDAYDCDDTTKDALTALAIQAFGGDVDIILSSDANSLMAKYLLSHDEDDAIEFKNAVKESAWEHFAGCFDSLIQEQINCVKTDSLQDAGKRPYTDRNTGETLWI